MTGELNNAQNSTIINLTNKPTHAVSKQAVSYGYPEWNPFDNYYAKTRDH